MHAGKHPVLLLIALLMVLFAFLMVEAWYESAKADDTDTAKPNAEIEPISVEEPDLDESSGLATSWRSTNRFWSHNDSGGKPKLYAFDPDGKKTGQCELTSIDAIDWEDMASFVEADVPRLLVADCGDNRSSRKSFDLYLLDEPDPDRTDKTDQFQTVSVNYVDGPRDCEAVAVDPTRKRIVLITKSPFPAAGIYMLPLPKRKPGRQVKTKETAKRVGTLPIPMITAMDIDPSSGDIWVLNYFQAFRFRCETRDEPIEGQLSRTPQSYSLPRLRQIEAGAVDRSASLWVTSEGSPTLMQRVGTDADAAISSNP